MKVPHLLFFIMALACSLPARPENARFDKLTVEDGLSDNRVLSIIQDSKGFMWFGTIIGLNRYDGYTIKQYLHDPDDSLSVADGWINDIFEDNAGNLWIGTQGGGLCRYDRDRDIFIRYTAKKGDPNSLCGNGINKIFQSSQGKLWIATNRGLNSYHPQSDNFSRYFPEKKDTVYKDNINVIGNITEDANGTLWISTWNQGLFYYDDAADSFQRYKPPPAYRKVFTNQYPVKLVAAAWENKHYLWIADVQNILYRIDIKNDQIKQYKLQSVITKNLDITLIRTLYHPPKSHELWIGTEDGGLLKYDMSSEKFISYGYKSGNPYSLSSNTVFSVFKDKNGLVWVGTPHGINKLNPSGQTFSTLRLDSGNPKGVSGEVVWGICETNNAGNESVLWFGSEDGLFSYNRTTGSVRRYRHETENMNSLSHTIIIPIIKTQSEDGSILWAGSQNGLNKIEPLKNRITRYYVSDNDPVFNMIGTLCSDKKGFIWLGTQSSYLIQFDPQTKRFTKHGSHYGKIRCLFSDLSGILWIGTESNGLFAYNPATNEEQNYRNVAGNINSISSNWIRSVTEDNNGSIWVGTAKGINKFNKSILSFTRFTENDGLAGNLVRAVLSDAKGSLWISTNKGLSYFDPLRKTFRNFTENDGLHNNEFWWAKYKNKKGEMFFGGKNGLTWFHPDSIKYNAYTPPVVLTDFQIFNKKIRPDDSGPLKKEISETSTLTLSHDQSVFSFEFAALEYHSPEKIRYSYKMENVDPDWVLTDAAHRFVTYTNLDPGTYQFYVKAANKDGIWSPQQASLKITILPPWYASGWAYALYVISFLALLYYLRRYELNRLDLKHEAAKWQELDSLKSRFFANISHEFRTPLTLILGPIQKFIEKSDDANDIKQFSMIRRNALRLKKLINQLLDLSRIESGKLQLKITRHDIVEVTRTIVSFFESHATRRNINLRFMTKIEQQDIYIDLDKYEKILTNLLSNAFKFSDDNSEIQVMVYTADSAHNGYKKESCYIEIKDSGIGISKENITHIFDRFYQVDASISRDYEGSGIGLALVKELVELHHGMISAESEPAKGTTFTIQLPLGKEHLSAEEILALPAEEIRIGNYQQPSEIMEEQISGINTENNLPLILVVEDNRDVQSYLAGVLEEDYNLVFAENGSSGIDQAIRHIPDLIVSDIMMPGMDGIEMCTKIKNDIATSHIPVILLTARAGQQDKLQGLATGADDYLAKPFDAAELQMRIRNLVEQRRRLQEKIDRLNPLSAVNLDIGKKDQDFLGKAIDIIKKNINDPSFDTDRFAAEIALSRSQLFRKLKNLSGKSVSEFIRFIRLQYAAELLKRKQGNVSEVAFEAGFNHLGNFSEHFKKQFGVMPSEYSKKQFKS